MPLGDICFLLRSGVIAAKNVPERRAGAFLCVVVLIMVVMFWCAHASTLSSLSPTPPPLTNPNTNKSHTKPTALDALGFDWGNPEAYIDLRWDIFLGTYYYWRLIKGVPLVPWDFVVPEEAPWPFFCRGVELGKMSDLVRRSQEVRTEQNRRRGLLFVLCVCVCVFMYIYVCIDGDCLSNETPPPPSHLTHTP
jgi:hypothetical protein